MCVYMSTRVCGCMYVVVYICMRVRACVCVSVNGYYVRGSAGMCECVLIIWDITGASAVRLQHRGLQVELPWF